MWTLTCKNLRLCEQREALLKHCTDVCSKEVERRDAERKGKIQKHAGPAEPEHKSPRGHRSSEIYRRNERACVGLHRDRREHHAGDKDGVATNFQLHEL